MAITEKELEHFQQFAKTKLNVNGERLTWQDLFQSWMLEEPPADERCRINAIIRQGTSDIDAGHTQSAEEVNEEMRQKYDLA